MDRTRTSTVESQRILLRPAEAAAALGISVAKVYALISAGELEAVHVGRARRIPGAALEEYVERLRQHCVTHAGKSADDGTPEPDPGTKPSL
jgi:excisionase family DNA binding protein